MLHLLSFLSHEVDDELSQHPAVIHHQLVDQLQTQYSLWLVGSAKGVKPLRLFISLEDLELKLQGLAAVLDRWRSWQKIHETIPTLALAKDTYLQNDPSPQVKGR